MSKWVRIGSVRCFDSVEADKAQALKVLEEAAEVFGAWQFWEGHVPREYDYARQRLLAECADVIQATANLMYTLGVDDARQLIDECERRQRERGRITDGN